MHQFVRCVLVLFWLGSATSSAAAIGPWDTAYLRGDYAASFTHHVTQLFARVAPAAEPATGATQALHEEIELRFLRLVVDELANFATGAETLERFLESEHHPIVTALAQNDLGYYYFRVGRVAEAMQSWTALDFINDWWLIGPFDNERGSGFDNPTEIETAIDLSASYVGKRDSVSWRRWAEPGRGCLVELSELLRPREEGFAYLSTALVADRALAAVLRLGSSGAIAIWLNGQEVFRRDVEREIRLDQDAVRIQLAAGPNTILIKSGHTKGQWALRLRLTDENGARITGVRIDADEIRDAVATPSAVETSESRPLQMGAIDWLAAKPDSLERLLLTAWILGQRRAHDVTEHPERELCLAALERDPNSAIGWWLLAASYLEEVTHVAEREENHWRQALEKALAIDPEFAAARVALARYYFERFRNVERASSYLAPLLESSAPTIAGLALASELAYFRHGEAARDAIRDVIESRFDREALPTWRHAHARRAWARGLVSEAEREFTAVLKLDALNLAARRDLYDLYVSLGRRDFALEQLDLNVALRPGHAGSWLAIGEHHAAADEWQLALAAVDRALLIAPADEASHARRGEYLLMAGRREAALESFARSLEREPNQPKLRDYVQRLAAGTKNLEDTYRVDLTATMAAARASTATSSDPSRVLFDQQVVAIDADGTSTRYRQFLVKIVNESGIREYNHYSIPYAFGEQWVKVLRARVHRSAGGTADAQLRQRDPQVREGEYPVWSAMWVDLPPLEIGDLVEIEYRQEDLRQSFFGDYFGDEVSFAGIVPMDWVRYTLLAPADKKLFFHQRQLAIEPTCSEQGGIKSWRWEVRDAAAVLPEPGMPELAEATPSLQISTFADWPAFTRWYHHLIRKQFESSAAIRAKVTELTQGKATAAEKIRAIYNFVVTDVRYIAWEFGVHGFKPYNAATVFARRFGDCKDKATLLCTMLDEIGIDANVVLINAVGQRSREDLSLPLMSHFNHCIAYLPNGLENSPIFLDGTAERHGAQELPTMDRGATVLVVDSARARVEQIPWNNPADQSVEQRDRIELRPDGSALGEHEISATGDIASRLRADFEIVGERTLVLERALGRRFPGSRVTEVTTSDLKDLDAAVRVRFRTEIPDFLDRSTNPNRLPAFVDFYERLRNLNALASREARDQDLLLGAPRRSQLRVELLLPAGYEISHLPKPLELTTPQAVFDFRATQDDRTLRIEQTLETRGPRVAAREYPLFRDLVERAGALLDERILLRKQEGVQ
ncbi:MAG: DUF3857 domain-containing protein [Planctomycetota bacterium]